MTPFKRKFDKAYARTLLKIASEELEMVKALVTQPVGRPETTCFLAQQVIEKSIKAVICHLGQPVPLIHDLGGLLAALPDAVSRPPQEAALPGLTEFATVRRYEEGQYQLTSEEVAQAGRAAESVVAWATNVIEFVGKH